MNALAKMPPEKSATTRARSAILLIAGSRGSSYATEPWSQLATAPINAQPLPSWRDTDFSPKWGSQCRATVSIFPTLARIYECVWYSLLSRLTLLYLCFAVASILFTFHSLCGEASEDRRRARAPWTSSSGRDFYRKGFRNRGTQRSSSFARRSVY